MYNKPYHKMPESSWMIPGGNRDQKRKLMKQQKYPMASAIQKNLGGPLSEAFFSCLTPTQQDHIGYTPKLKGPGRDLWVAPSDILVDKMVLTVPYTSRLRQALTHQGITEMGAEIEDKLYTKYLSELEEARLAKEREMKVEMDRNIKEAVEADRKVQQLINNHVLEKASSDLSKTYQEVLANSVNQVLEEGTRKLEKAVEKTKQEMEEELCLAVSSRSDYLDRQFQFQRAWRESELTEKYHNIIKKCRQDCLAAMNQVQRELESELKRSVACSKAEHNTDLLIEGAERSEWYHEEKKQVDRNFEIWFEKHFEEEIVNKDFTIIGLEDTIRELEAKCDRREEQLKKIFWHFQKFINFALKEKPCQAEFLLNLQKELQEKKLQVKREGELEYIARTILELIIKAIDDSANKGKTLQKTTFADSSQFTTENKGKTLQKTTFADSSQFTTENFRERLNKQKEKLQILQLTGEELSITTNPTTRSSTATKFRKSQLESMKTFFDKSSSLIPVLSEIAKVRASAKSIKS